MRRLALPYLRHYTQTRSRQDVTSDRLQPALLLYPYPIGNITDRQFDPFQCHDALDQMPGSLRLLFEQKISCGHTCHQCYPICWFYPPSSFLSFRVLYSRVSSREVATMRHAGDAPSTTLQSYHCTIQHCLSLESPSSHISWAQNGSSTITISPVCCQFIPLPPLCKTSMKTSPHTRPPRRLPFRAVIIYGLDSSCWRSWRRPGPSLSGH